MHPHCWNNKRQHIVTFVATKLNHHLVIRAKTALFSLVSIKRAPAAVRLFAASANDVNHAVIFMRGAEPFIIRFFSRVK